MGNKKLSDAEVKRIAALYKDLVENTDITKGGCNVCGKPGHVAGDHDAPRKQGR